MATICEPKSELVKEHAQLVKTLRTGTKRDQKKEATKQARELKGYRKAKGRTNGRGSNRS